LDFVDFALSRSLEANRSVKLTPVKWAFDNNLTGQVKKISASIDWSRVEAVLMQYYSVGTRRPSMFSGALKPFPKLQDKPESEAGEGCTASYLMVIMGPIRFTLRKWMPESIGCLQSSNPLLA
jgi:hypothetical protein